MLWNHVMEMPKECKHHKFVGKLSKGRCNEIYEICLEGQISRKPIGIPIKLLQSGHSQNKSELFIGPIHYIP